MSIIHDALKKTQLKLSQTGQISTNAGKSETIIPKKTENIKPQPSSLPEIPAQIKPTNKKKNKVFIPVIITAIAILIISFVILTFSHKSIPQLFTKFTSTKIYQTAVSTTTKTKFNTDLILNGTMMMENRRVALINNEIYELGENIKGMKIININLEKVDLLNDNDVVTLHVRKHINQ